MEIAIFSGRFSMKSVRAQIMDQALRAHRADSAAWRSFVAHLISSSIFVDQGPRICIFSRPIPCRA